MKEHRQHHFLGYRYCKKDSGEISPANVRYANAAANEVRN